MPQRRSEESETLVERIHPNEEEGCIERFVTPRVVLALFTLVNFITYYDRGVMSSSLSSIRSDSSIAGDDGTISDTKGGFIVSAFMVGFMLTCPLFAALGGTFTAKRIIVAGLLVWAGACVMSGFSHGYGMLLVARMFVGVGEAAYAGYTVTIIDNIAPKESRTRWIGTFYSMIPVGTAIGMAGGGVISTDGGVGSIAGWRVAFFTEVVASIPIILLVGFLPNKYNPTTVASKGAAANDASHDREEFVSLPAAAKALITNIRFVLVVFGYGMYVFVTGAIAVWAISMLTEGPLHLSTVPASLLMGGATALTGVCGSIAGGLFVDRMGGSQGIRGTMKCQLFNVGMMCISVPCGLIALTANSLWLFIVFFVISVFSLFAVTAPVNASILTVVPSNLRTYAISFSVFAIHLMGDFPSPTVAGSLSDKFANGCPDLTNVTCTSVPSQNCRWVPPADHEEGSCVNIYQLRNALAIVYCFLLFAIPAWAVVFVLVRREYRQSLSAATGDNEYGYTARSLGTTNSDVESLKSANRFVGGAE